MDKIYVDTVRLLLDTAPHVFHSDRFALKGGTALNLFGSSAVSVGKSRKKLGGLALHYPPRLRRC